MKSTTRYGLIVLSFIIFIVAAPLLILYVSGRTINLEGRDTNTTGLLDAKSNPSGAQVTIDDKDYSTTPAIARFLKQGEYVVKLTKDGYYDWTKRLPIESGKVTYAQEGVTEVQLIKKTQPKILINAPISNFVLVNDVMWFGQNNNLISAPVSNPASQTTVNLNFHPNTIVLLRDRNHLFISGDKNHAIYDLQNKQILKIPTPYSNDTTDPAKMVFAPGNVLLYVDSDNNLNAYDFGTGKNSEVKNNVAYLTMVDTTAYFASADKNANKGTISLAYWIGSNFTDEQTILDNTQTGPLYITDNKELFCSCGNSFGRVGKTFEELGPKSTVNLDLATNELSYLTNGNELMFYNFLGNKTQLLTRGAFNAQDTFLIRSSIGYGFVGTTSGLEAIEIDNRDHQNRYQLISDKKVSQIALTANQKTILALVDGSIVSLDIRN